MTGTEAIQYLDVHNLDIKNLDNIVRTYLLGLPRFYIVFVIMPVLSKRFLGGGMIRNGVILSIALFLYPVNAGSIPAEMSNIDYFSILLKETVLGIIIGYIATIPFWVAEGVGFLIDNQRGASMASTVNPMLREQTPPLGIFFSQLLCTLFVISGAMLALILVLVKSYVLWPVGVFFPEIFDGLDVFALSQLDYLMTLIVVLSAPVVASMFLAEFALGLISRFSPQLNVFFLAMPIKSAVAFVVLILYMKYFVMHLMTYIDEIPQVILDLLTSAQVS